MVRTMLGFSAMVEGASPAASRSGKPRGELGGELVRLVSIDTTRKRPKFDEAGLQPCDSNTDPVHRVGKPSPRKKLAARRPFEGGPDQGRPASV